MPRSRRYFSPSFKRQVVLEILTGETTEAAYSLMAAIIARTTLTSSASVMSPQ